MPRNRNIRPRGAQAIVDLIRGWPQDKISWELLCEACEPILGYVPSRQGLSSHQSIQQAFQAKKAGLKVQPPRESARPSSLAVAGQRIANLNAEVAELRAENNRLRERLVTWQYNAVTKGRMTIAKLNEPLPRIDRERNEDQAAS